MIGKNLRIVILLIGLSFALFTISCSSPQKPNKNDETSQTSTRGTETSENKSDVKSTPIQEDSPSSEETPIVTDLKKPEVGDMGILPTSHEVIAVNPETIIYEDQYENRSSIAYGDNVILEKNGFISVVAITKDEKGSLIYLMRYTKVPDSDYLNFPQGLLFFMSGEDFLCARTAYMDHKKKIEQERKAEQESAEKTEKEKNKIRELLKQEPKAKK